MSGYFRPLDNQLGHKKISPFASPRQKLANTPDYELAALPAGAVIPRFWLGVGTGDRAGVEDAKGFFQLLRQAQPAARLRLVPGGHTAFTWRELLPPMLEWMTRGLARAPVPTRTQGCLRPLQETSHLGPQTSGPAQDSASL